MSNNVIDVEEIHTILKGATRMHKHLKTGKFKENNGADFNITVKWFKKCGIIDGKLIKEDIFIQHYERLAPNREDLTLTQMVTLFSILAREGKKNVNYFAAMFELVKDDVTDEIRKYWREVEERHKEETANYDPDDVSEDSSNDGRLHFAL